MSEIVAKPAKCPACTGPMRGRILVCETCWFKASLVDRATFRSLYLRNPTKPKCWATIAAKIIRTVTPTL